MFNPTTYLDRYPDVKAAVEGGFISAYDHFLLFGVHEDRSPLSFFDADAYLLFNPDVKAAVERGETSAIAHFLLYGIREERQVSIAVNVQKYLDANPDVASAVERGETTAIGHLLRSGVEEGRDLGNGLSLAYFLHDKKFLDAWAQGTPDQALNRVDSLAPFFPNVELPVNYTFAGIVPYPNDYVPPQGILL